MLQPQQSLLGCRVAIVRPIVFLLLFRRFCREVFLGVEASQAILVSNIKKNN
jgi:hypothetical protein